MMGSSQTSGILFHGRFHGIFYTAWKLAGNLNMSLWPWKQIYKASFFEFHLRFGVCTPQDLPTLRVWALSSKNTLSMSSCVKTLFCHQVCLWKSFGCYPTKKTCTSPRLWLQLPLKLHLHKSLANLMLVLPTRKVELWYRSSQSPLRGRKGMKGCKQLFVFQNQPQKSWGFLVKQIISMKSLGDPHFRSSYLNLSMSRRIFGLDPLHIDKTEWRFVAPLTNVRPNHTLRAAKGSLSIAVPPPICSNIELENHTLFI